MEEGLHEKNRRFQEMITNQDTESSDRMSRVYWEGRSLWLRSLPVCRCIGIEMRSDGYPGPDLCSEGWVIASVSISFHQDEVM